MSLTLPLFGPASVQIEESKDMLRTAWMAYDREGQVLQCGVAGLGTRKEREGIVARIVCGVEVYQAVAAVARIGGRVP
jgi:hypothetical protein